MTLEASHCWGDSPWLRGDTCLPRAAAALPMPPRRHPLCIITLQARKGPGQMRALGTEDNPLQLSWHHGPLGSYRRGGGSWELQAEARGTEPILDTERLCALLTMASGLPACHPDPPGLQGCSQQSMGGVAIAPRCPHRVCPLRQQGLLGCTGPGWELSSPGGLPWAGKRTPLIARPLAEATTFLA